MIGSMGSSFPENCVLCRFSACVFTSKNCAFEVGCTRKFATKSTEGPGVIATHENVAEVNGYSAFFFLCRKNVFEFLAIFVGNTYEMPVVTDNTPCIESEIQKRS